MRQMGIKAQRVKPYAQTTIDSDFSKELHNILQQQFNPEQPDAVWVSDITYIWTFEGLVYLTSIMDLYSRKIIAWVLNETLGASHVVDCVEKAKRTRSITQPLIIHTDRGCLYCHSRVYAGNGAASGEAPCLCQWGTETSWCFTIRL